ncbi:MAG TPA: hypothetical protein VM425_03870 [Myxococcota bacterium]|nr:hypothetical protein [Myxococcota bacterium]
MKARTRRVSGGLPLLILLLALLGQACGVKGAPRPPLDLKSVPDAGTTVTADGGGQCSKDR